MPSFDEQVSSSMGGKILQSLPTLEESSPPRNGAEVMQRVSLIIESLFAGHLAYAEFNQPSGQKLPGKMEQLQALLQSGKNAKNAQSSSSGTQAPKTEPTKSQPSTAPPSPEFKEARVMHGVMPQFMDPLTKKIEDDDARRTRLLLQGVFVTIAGTKFRHLVQSATPGDICAHLHNFRLLVRGDEASSIVNAVISMVKMAISPPKTWPLLSEKIAELQVDLSASSNPGLQLGGDLLPLFCLRALEHFPSFATEVSMLREARRAGQTPGVTHILSVMHTRAADIPAGVPQKGVVGMVGRMPTPARQDDETVPRPPQRCRNFAKNGVCSYGSKCIFLHEEASSSKGVCAECGSKSHGFGECPKRRARTEHVKQLEAKLAQQKLELQVRGDPSAAQHGQELAGHHARTTPALPASPPPRLARTGRTHTARMAPTRRSLRPSDCIRSDGRARALQKRGGQQRSTAFRCGSPTTA